ncbi:MAG: TIGR00289 family protein [Candidatus Aenigmatarchaeota archaeon]
MKVAVLFSGGKDSTYSAFLLSKQGYKIEYLVTILPKAQDSWMFHFPCIELTKLQAKALGIKHLIEKTEGKKEKELEDLKNALEKIKNKVEGVVSGCIASSYQKNRIYKICLDLGLKHITPLWHRNSEELLREEIDSGFDIIITGIFSEGFNKNWLGRRIDEKTIEDLITLSRKYGVNLSGEGGEYESLTLDCPIFKKKIKILDYEKIWNERSSSGYLVVKDAILENKVSLINIDSNK